MSMLTREFNYMRKSQRVDIPLLVRVAGKIYKASDWSMTGLGILDYPDDSQPGETVAMSLVLPIVGASLHVEVQAVRRSIRGKVTGFEFLDLPARHKRVLRHYVELSLEGKLDSIEDLLSDFTVPDIESPIKEALNITEEEQSSLLRKFKNRAFLTMFAGVLLLGYILITLLYNTVFVYETIGVAAGNLVQVTAGGNGFLKRHHVKVGDEVRLNDILFDLEDTRQVEELRKNDQQLAQEERLHEQLSGKEQGGSPSRLLELLREDFQKRQREYESAARLYREKVISIKDFQFVENELARARINLVREEEQQVEAVRSFEEKRNLVAVRIDLLKSERQRLLQSLENLRVKAPINGAVFAIAYFSGEYLTPNDVVVTLATKENPFILFKMPSRESGKAQLGMAARVYSYETGQTHRGVISSIGYSAINPRTTLLQEVSLEQTIIKVDLVEGQADIPLNSRVNVWIRQDIRYFSWLVDLLGKLRGGLDAETLR